MSSALTEMILAQLKQHPEMLEAVLEKMGMPPGALQMFKNAKIKKIIYSESMQVWTLHVNVELRGQNMLVVIAAPVELVAQFPKLEKFIKDKEQENANC